MSDLATFAGKTVLITGASSGIGRAFAHRLAAADAELVLVARRADALARLAETLRDRHGATVRVIPADLARPGAAADLYRTLLAQGLDIDALINNAGIGIHGDLADADLGTVTGQIQLNVTTVAELSSLVLPAMVARGHGAIVNIASIAAFQPIAHMAVYAATKAFVLSFTEALHQELKPHGVRVTVLCPGPVRTEFQERAGFKPQYDSAMLDVPAAEVARQGYVGLMANKRAVLPGFGIKAVPLMLRLFPRGFILWAIGHFQTKRR